MMARYAGVSPRCNGECLRESKGRQIRRRRRAAKGGEGGPMKALLVPVVVVAVITPVVDKPPVIKEWTVPWPDSRPRDPFVDPPTKRLWFCGPGGEAPPHILSRPR